MQEREAKILNKVDLQAIRVEIASKICLAYSSAYEKATSTRPAVDYRDENEKMAVQVLQAIFKVEPSVKHILRFYMQRTGMLHLAEPEAIVPFPLGA